MKTVYKIILMSAMLTTSITFAQNNWQVNAITNISSPVVNEYLATNNNILGTGLSGYELNCSKSNEASFGYVKISKTFSTIHTASLTVWFRNNNGETHWTANVYLGGNQTPITSSSPITLSLTGDNVKITFTLGSAIDFDRIEFLVSYYANTGPTRTIWFNDIRTAENTVIDTYGATPLPVELNSFTGKMTAKGVTLNWTTATEVNNYGFEVERKSTGNNWEKIAFVSGNGNSNSPKLYSYTDSYINLKVKKHLYRLKQIDNDGKFVYSQEISLNYQSPKSLTLRSYPNPFNPVTTINFVLPENSLVNLSVYNSLGQKVSELLNGYFESGVKEIQLNGHNLPSGTYIIRLLTPAGQINKKILLLK